MKIERSKNAARNMLAGSLLKIFQMLIPFLMRTVMIQFMGSEYLGLSSLFKSVLNVLNLAELGVGSAMVYSMYKPIAEDDTRTINALMRLYRTYYRLIGVTVAVLGLLLYPFIPRLVTGTVPSELNLGTLYLMNLAVTVLSYWLFAYKGCLLNAHQRVDVTNIVLLATQILQFALQMVVIIFLHDYYLYVIVVLLTQVLNNIFTAIAAGKMYPNYHPIGNIPKEERKEINTHIRDLFISKLGGTVLGSADTMVISAFLGLSVLAEYQNYVFVLASIRGFMTILLNSMLAGIGNSMLTENSEKNYRDFNTISLLFTGIVSVCMCCFAGMFQPFIKLWMGEDMMLPYGMVVSFCVYFAARVYTQFFNTFKSAAGEWHHDRFRPLISAVVNLTLNLLLVTRIGLYGIVWSSILSLAVIEIPWLLQNVFATIYKQEHVWRYVKKLGLYLLCGCAAWGLTIAAAQIIQLGGLMEMVICGLIAVIVPTVLFVLFFRKQDEFRHAVGLLDRMTKRKLHLMQRFHLN